MLSSLLIRNYRIFKKIEVTQLKRVNLFVGKNNTGKSCLLEALQIYASKGDPQTINHIISSRDENWNTRTDVNTFYQSLAYLFNGYALPEAGKDPIVIGPIDDYAKQLIMSIKPFQISEDEEGRKIRIAIDPTKIKEDMIDMQLALETTMDQKRCHYIALDSHPFVNQSYKNVAKLTSNYQIVKTQHISDEKVSELWDNINLTDLEAEILSCLKIINTNISGIALVSDVSGRLNNLNKRIPIVRIKGVKERIPIKTMGDGLTRLFHIILALVNAKNGLLLIDEFENGLHWTVLPKIWYAMIKLSKALNVQVIATTHSRDCIKGFNENWKSNENDGSFYRLENEPENGGKIIPYTNEILSDAIESEVEVR
jgi:AAA15 family ATPase/GTPase